MKKLFTLLLVVLVIQVNAQDSIEWQEGYKLELADFASSRSQIGNGNELSISLMTNIDFSFHMPAFVFMSTKNFNSKVTTTLHRKSSILMAPDNSQGLALLNLGRYDFDLTELYARKLRKRLYEEKGAFSDVSFFQPIYDELTTELMEIRQNAIYDTDFGRKEVLLAEMHTKVLDEIAELADFCKTCKPTKKAKSK